MRTLFAAVLLAGALGLVSMPTTSAAPASGATLAQAASQVEQLVLVRQGCGRGFHRNRHGVCVPNHP